MFLKALKLLAIVILTCPNQAWLDLRDLHQGGKDSKRICMVNDINALRMFLKIPLDSFIM